MAVTEERVFPKPRKAKFLKLGFRVTITKSVIIQEMHDEGGWNFVEIAEYLDEDLPNIRSLYQGFHNKNKR